MEPVALSVIGTRQEGRYSIANRVRTRSTSWGASRPAR